MAIGGAAASPRSAGAGCGFSVSCRSSSGCCSADFEIRGLDAESGVVYVCERGLDGEGDISRPSRGGSDDGCREAEFVVCEGGLDDGWSGAVDGVEEGGAGGLGGGCGDLGVVMGVGFDRGGDVGGVGAD